MKPVTFIIIMLLAVQLHAQQIYPPKIRILIDTTIRPMIDRSSPAGALGTLDVRLVINDNEEINTFGSKRKMDFITHTYFVEDTLFILGLGRTSELGFYLELHGDSSRVSLFATTDGPAVYKLFPSDTVYQRKISVGTTFCRLTLARLPVYKDGEVIEGFVEMDSHEFYGKSGKEKNDDKVQVKISAYFRTLPITTLKK